MIEANLTELFASCARDAYRLETLQAYSVPGEQARVAAWRAGEPWPAGLTPWQQRLRDLINRGVRARRVHVVELPLTEYLHWEIASYQRNARYGEEIRLLESGQAPQLAMTDYWLFDDRTVVLMHYDPDGRLLARDLYNGDPAPYVAARDAVWTDAEELSAWCKHGDRE